MYMYVPYVPYMYAVCIDQVQHAKYRRRPTTTTQPMCADEVHEVHEVEIQMYEQRRTATKA